LQPIANLIAAEASEKVTSDVTIDVMQPLRAFDAGGRAWAASQVVQLQSLAKESGVNVEDALKLVNWD